jgi:D-alanine-D-alanine ligase
MRRPRICVLSGGISGESRASRISAAAVYGALAASKYEVVWLDLSAEEEWGLRSTHPHGLSLSGIGDRDSSASWQETFVSLAPAAGVELVFPVIHGAIGEDGQIQTLCESLSLPYVGCGPDAAITCYDKAAFKRVISTTGLPVARHVPVQRQLYEDDPTAVAAAVRRQLGYPCIVKPSRGGSSLGLSRVETCEALDPAISLALGFGEVALVEQFFAGSDVEMGVLEDGSSVIGSPVEIEYEGDLYDFETKYAGDRDRRHLPARIPAPLAGRLTQAARAAFHCTGCCGMARVDFLVDRSTERFVVNEINTIPYMPERSTFATSLRHTTGQTYRSLVTSLAQFAWDGR